MAETNDPADANPPRLQVLREFLADLFDLELRVSMAARMLPAVYVLGIALAAILVCYLTYSGFRESRTQGLLWLLLLGPATFFGLVTALRITLEFVMAVFRMAWYVEQVANHTQVVSEELPRFTFLRTLLFGTGSNKPKETKGDRPL